MIAITELRKSFGEREVLRGITLEVRPGQILGLLGPNGAGKSTTMRILTGGLRPTSGQVFVNGLSVTGDDGSWRGKLGYLPEQNPLYGELYTYEYLHYVGNLYGLRNVRKRVEEIGELTGLAAMRGRRIKILSKGYKQRVGLAAALLCDPDTLILDEATNGLDPNQIVEIRNVIREVGRNRAVLFSTHIMQEVEALCDSVAIIREGALVAVSSTAELLRSRSERVYVVGFVSSPTREVLQGWCPDALLSQEPSGDWLIRSSLSEDLRPRLFEAASHGGYTLHTLYQRTSHLEEVFHSLTVS